MFEALREFIRSIGGEAREDGRLDADDPRVAAAALFFHIVNADGVVTDAERRRLGDVLAEEFGLAPGEAGRIAEAGRLADAEAVDLYRFTSVLKAGLDAGSRARFVELLWEMSYADGEVHELEDNLVWRISELMGVSTRDRMSMKRDVAVRSGPAN